MKRTFAVAALLGAIVAAAGLVYQTAARERDYRTLLARGDAALRDDQTFAAIEAYSGAIALRPRSMLAYLRRGETYRRRADRGDLDAAARDFRTASQLDPSAPRPLEELGDVSYQLQRYDRASAAYERFVRLDDRSARVGYKLAVSRYRDGDVDGALAALDQTVRIDERLADAHYLLGICLRERHRNADAIRALERAVALAPAAIPPREELAALYADQGRRADQIEQLQVLAGLDRDRVERHVDLALAHARAHHWDSAVITLGAALERMPDNSALYRALGQVWLDSSQVRSDRVDLSKAREALDRVASAPAATSEVLALAGRAAMQEGDWDAAEHALQQAIARYPLDPQALVLYATVAERLAHLQEARDALVQYRSLARTDADDAALIARIAALSLRLGERDAAVEWTQRGLARDPQNAALLALSQRVSRP